MMEKSMVVSSPIGNLRITEEYGELTKLEFVEAPLSKTDNELLLEAASQLKDYFKGKRKDFTLPLKVKGTAFQTSVWEALLGIPYGTTCSYQEIAEKIENPKAVRAIGQANKANSLPIFIPCHRVVGKDKSLTGYAGKQLDKKEILLKLEMGK